MKKSFLVLAALGLVAVGVTSCGTDNNTVNPDDPDTPTASIPTGEYATVQEFAKAFAGSGIFSGDYEYEVKIWQPEEILETTEASVNALVSAINSEFKSQGVDASWNISLTFEAVGEGDAASNMITDVTAGADLYNFAQDQLSRLITAGAVSKLGGTWDTIIKSYNDAGAVSAVSYDNFCYAFPITSDNGYFLYYNTDYLSEADTEDLATMVKKLSDAGRKFGYNYTSAWYNMGIFYANGCESTWTTNDAGQFTAYKDSYSSDAGKAALKGFYDATWGVDKGAIVDTSSGSDAANGVAAIVDGTWDYGTIKAIWGDKMACTDLPSFKVNGESKHLASFSGNKLMGVKPQTDTKKALVCYTIADYLSSNIAQAERYAANGWGPSNKAVAATINDEDAPHLAALSKQADYSTPQGQYPNGWWDLAGAIGTSTAASTGTEEELSSILSTYAGSLDTCVYKAIDWSTSKLSIIGSLTQYGYNWDTDIDMTPDSSYNTFSATGVKLASGDSWKLRLDHAWNESWGQSYVTDEDSLAYVDATSTDNIVMTVSGVYTVTYNTVDNQIKLVKTGEL